LTTTPQRIRVHNFSVSVDGYAAGPDQSVNDPLGKNGQRLHEWVFETRTGRRMLGQDGGTVGVDDEFMARGTQGIGATVMGRNMFGPVRGPWGDETWKGWWGDEPPFHHPVFVLSHHPRAPIEMSGGTVFHFVDAGIDVALARAIDAAGDLDVRIGGGVSVIQQLLLARLIDDLHVAIVPVLLGRGERLFDHLDGGPVGYECVERVCSPAVTHVVLSRTS
jgi:dihydrofolate reductase